MFPENFRVLGYVSRSHQSDLSKSCKHWDIFLSHCKICLVQPMPGSTLGNRGFTTEFISATFRQKVVQRLEHFSDEQLLDMFSKFGGQAQGMTGLIFEALVHRCFKRHINLHAMPMFWSDHANSYRTSKLSL